MFILGLSLVEGTVELLALHMTLLCGDLVLPLFAFFHYKNIFVHVKCMKIIFTNIVIQHKIFGQI